MMIFATGKDNTIGPSETYAEVGGWCTNVRLRAPRERHGTRPQKASHRLRKYELGYFQSEVERLEN
jgi:hypothetical protein